MCGITALYPRSGAVPPSAPAISTMLETMRRRGPDHSGIAIAASGALGAARLRIRDPAATADQPFANHDATLRIAFNGEIFNNDALRKRLGPPPGGWRTGCDVETVLSGYEALGPAIVEELEGQFAFAILDDRNRTMLVARDPFGICPLFLAEVGDLVVASSSLRAILAGFPGRFRRSDPLGIAETLLLRFPLAPNTVVAGIRQLPPGELAVFDGEREHRRRHWSLPQPAAPTGGQDEEDRLAELLEHAVAGNCLSDAPVGLFLSGGLDSGIVAALAASRLASGTPAATLAFAGPDGEGEAARALAARFGYRSHLVDVETLDPHALVADTLDAMDMPLGARDAPAVMAMARALREAEPAVKVVLTGTGSDEQFGGYRNTYFGPAEGSLEQQISHFMACYSAIEPSRRASVLALVGPDAVADMTARLAATLAAMAPWLASATPARVLDLLYMTTHLPGWELATADMMCMHCSLEARVPFLDRHLVGFSLTRADPDARNGAPDKALLRRTAARWLGAKASARPKLPLSRPLAAWIERAAPWQGQPAGPLADLGLDPCALAQMTGPGASFDLRWRVQVLQRWLDRHLAG